MVKMLEKNLNEFGYGYSLFYSVFLIFEIIHIIKLTKRDYKEFS